MDYMERIVHHMEGYGRFEMRLAPDGQYGREQNGKWSGMIGEIIENVSPCLRSLLEGVFGVITLPFSASSSVSSDVQEMQQLDPYRIE